MKIPPSLARPRTKDSPEIVAASVIHDLGNLIQIATAAISVVARTPTMPAEHSAPLIRRARTCLEHAGALARQNVGRMRDQAVARDDRDIAACLGQVVALVDNLADAGLILVLDLDPGLPGLACDPFALQSAMLNLVFNARDAMAGNGTVVIRARALEDGASPAFAEICVSDDGVGMSPATIARAFEPFFTTKSDGLGGVGLPMVERFVREAGGDIVIESQPGVGTTVSLRLPSVGAAEADQFTFQSDRKEQDR